MVDARETRERWGKMPMGGYAGFSPDPIPRTYTGSDNTYNYRRTVRDGINYLIIKRTKNNLK